FRGEGELLHFRTGFYPFRDFYVVSARSQIVQYLPGIAVDFSHSYAAAFGQVRVEPFPIGSAAEVGLLGYVAHVERTAGLRADAIRNDPKLFGKVILEFIDNDKRILEGDLAFFHG